VKKEFVDYLRETFDKEQLIFHREDGNCSDVSFEEWKLKELVDVAIDQT